MMLTSEFDIEMGSLLRSLSTKVRLQPELLVDREGTEIAKDQIDRAIISLVALRLSL